MVNYVIDRVCGTASEPGFGFLSEFWV
jgi:hypothetical protein